MIVLSENYKEWLDARTADQIQYLIALYLRKIAGYKNDAKKICELRHELDAIRNYLGV